MDHEPKVFWSDLAFSVRGSCNFSCSFFGASIKISPKIHASGWFREHAWRAFWHQSPIDSQWTAILFLPFEKCRFHISDAACIDSSAVPAPENSVRTLIWLEIGVNFSLFKSGTTLMFQACNFALSGGARRSVRYSGRCWCSGSAFLAAGLNYRLALIFEV